MTVSPALDAAPMSLAGRNIIITGAGQGIGLATARMVVALGGSVTLVDLNAAALEGVVAELGESRALACSGSVADPELAPRVVTESVARFGAVHGLVNCAGITRPAMITKMGLDQWQQVIDVHLTGAFLFTQAVGIHMVDRHKAGDTAPGSIVSLSSDAGVQGTIGQVNYATAKAGLLGMMMAAAREWGRYGIRANSIAFGMVETPMTETIRSEKFRDTYLSKIPMGRWSSPKEAAGPICFLLSDAASFITGQRISANGGSQMNP